MGVVFCESFFILFIGVLRILRIICSFKFFRVLVFVCDIRYMFGNFFLVVFSRVFVSDVISSCEIIVGVAGLYSFGV